MDVGLYVWDSLVSGAGIMFGLVPFKTCPLLAKLFVVLVFFSLVVWLVSSSSFSLSLSLSLSLSFSLSLRRWGNPSPVWGLGFPLCSLLLGRALRVYDPYSLLLFFTKVPAPALVFFSFFSSALARVFLGMCVGRCLRSCSVGWSVPLLRCVQDA